MLGLVKRWRARNERAAEDEALLTPEERAENERVREEQSSLLPGYGQTSARIWEDGIDSELEPPKY